MINLTENAKNQINEILLDDGGKYVRAFVQGGGCSGFSYGFMIEEEKAEILMEAETPTNQFQN